jgi:hypothetical protein
VTIDSVSEGAQPGFPRFRRVTEIRICF